MLLGIDEVGRGPWAGPLVVGAVILGDKFPTDINLTDSKKLTAKQREALAPVILEKSLAHSLGWVSAAELDKVGLSAALRLATRRAVKKVLAQISQKPQDQAKLKIDNIIIDGTVNFLRDTPLEKLVSTLPKADLLVREVSAASIIAKVARDHYMVEIASQYPAYGFEKHVGYETALHKKALLEHGICPEHRKSFRPIREIRGIMPENSKAPSTSQKGQTAELAVAEYLRTQGHAIIAHNFKTKSYEIDLISRKNDQIFFTEVKYSQNSNLEGTPLVRITPKKQARMQFAATKFLAEHGEYQSLNPTLAAAAVSGPNFQLETWFPLV